MVKKRNSTLVFDGTVTRNMEFLVDFMDYSIYNREEIEKARRKKWQIIS